MEVAVDDVNGEGYATVSRRTSPGTNDIVNKGYLDTRLTAKQDTLVFDSTPILNSTKPVTSGGIYNNLLTKADKSELTDGLALKVDKGGSITTGNRVISYDNIATGTWRKCRDSYVTNFNTFMCNHQNFSVDISIDMSDIINVCKKVDSTNADGWETFTFMVPTEWWYRVTHDAGKPNKMIEQPIFIN